MTDTRSIMVERELAHPPERIWRALTQPELIAEWLMKFDFAPVVGHRFGVTQEWGSIDCEVLEVEPERTLSYSWGDHDLASVVTWRLTPTGRGTLLRMEQSGFTPDQPRYYHGAKAGWPRFLDNLEALLARIADRG